MIAAGAASVTPAPIDAIAERYIRLALSLGVHDADYIDAYYGPVEWKTAADAKKVALPDIRLQAKALIADLDKLKRPSGSDELATLRYDYLRKQMEALDYRAAMLGGRRGSFDEETKALYDTHTMARPDAYYQGLLKDLDAALPGTGDVVVRYNAFRERFYIPRGKVDAAFKTAIDECRRRTAAHIELPPTESFTVEYVTGKSWSAYNWYKGRYRSVIQVNTEFPIEVDRVIDLACHEGYPGHHVYNVLLEKTLVDDRGWKEFSVYPLFSPQSLIAEGTANYGIDVAFPGDERMKYERDVIFPLVGFDKARAAEYRNVQRLFGRLSHAGNEAARRYLEGTITATEAAVWLEKYALYSPERALQRVRFIDQYRSYVINYNHGKDLVGQYVEWRVGTEENPEKRWEEFQKLLASPRLPGALIPQ